MALPFANKVITITGGARGIGRATAKLLAQRGATVCIADIRNHELTETTAWLKTEMPNVRVKPSVVDVRDFRSVQTWTNEVEGEFGKLDGCLNGAGIAGNVGRKMVDYEDADFDTVIGVNLKGVFNCLRAQLAVVESGGSIVNISSVAGLSGHPGFGAYVASKFGVRGLTRVAAHEVADRDVRVNAICPGAVNTDMMRLINETIELTPDNTPQLFRRSADPSEIAALVAFLLSDGSKFMTGADYRIDAGYTC